MRKHRLYLIIASFVLTGSIFAQVKNEQASCFYLNPDSLKFDNIVRNINWEWNSRKDPTNKKISAQSLFISGAFRVDDELAIEYYEEVRQKGDKKLAVTFLISAARGKSESLILDSLFTLVKSEFRSKKQKKLIQELDNYVWTDPRNDALNNDFAFIEASALYEATGDTLVLTNLIKNLNQDDMFMASACKSLLQKYFDSDPNARLFILKEVENENYTDKAQEILSTIISD